MCGLDAYSFFLHIQLCHVPVPKYIYADETLRSATVRRVTQYTHTRAHAHTGTHKCMHVRTHTHTYTYTHKVQPFLYQINILF